MVIGGKVYDITDYIRFHPGGLEIMKGAGRDGTQLYMRYHPWVNVEALVGNYMIGFLQ